MKLWYKKYSGCEKKRLAHFFQAAMHHYYELCLKGESYDVAYTQTSIVLSNIWAVNIFIETSKYLRVRTRSITN